MSTKALYDGCSDGESGCILEVFRLDGSHIATVNVDDDASVGQFIARLSQALKRDPELCVRSFDRFVIGQESFEFSSCYTKFMLTAAVRMERGPTEPLQVMITTKT